MNDQEYKSFVLQELKEMNQNIQQLKTAIDERDEYTRCKINTWLDEQRELWLDRLMTMIGDDDSDEWWKGNGDNSPEFDTE